MKEIPSLVLSQGSAKAASNLTLGRLSNFSSATELSTAQCLLSLYIQMQEFVQHLSKPISKRDPWDLCKFIQNHHPKSCCCVVQDIPQINAAPQNSLKPMEWAQYQTYQQKEASHSSLTRQSSRGWLSFRNAETQS